eukprot:12528616-Alexandrium_andersonii.AAC.1
MESNPPQHAERCGRTSSLSNSPCCAHALCEGAGCSQSCVAAGRNSRRGRRRLRRGGHAGCRGVQLQTPRNKAEPTVRAIHRA